MGWLLGGPRDDARRVLVLVTGQRNISAVLVVASQSFTDQRVTGDGRRSSDYRISDPDAARRGVGEASSSASNLKRGSADKSK